MKAIPGILIGLLICLFFVVMRVAAQPPQEAPPAQNPPRGTEHESCASIGAWRRKASGSFREADSGSRSVHRDNEAGRKRSNRQDQREHAIPERAGSREAQRF